MRLKERNILKEGKVTEDDNDKHEKLWQKYFNNNNKNNALPPIRTEHKKHGNNKINKKNFFSLFLPEKVCLYSWSN